MEIEILTTKKKLSKSLVLQMKSANLEQMKYAVQFPHLMLGYVTNLSKDINQAIIIKGTTDYYIIPVIDWTLSGDTGLNARLGGYWNRNKQFPSEEERTEWLDVYNSIVKFTKYSHIYL